MSLERNGLFRTVGQPGLGRLIAVGPKSANHVLMTRGTNSSTHSRFGGGMTTQRRRGLHGDLRTTHTKKQPTANKYHARRFPIQHEIRKLEDELNSFNERIAELEDEGHRGHAMEVLKINALDFARRIDELRCILVESSPRDTPGGRSPKRSNRNCPGSPLVGTGSK